jgi:sec-independent protein translocase protein TatC
MPLKIKERIARKRDSSGDPEEFRMSLGDHIGELRFRLIRVVFVVTVGWIVGWFLQPWLYETLNAIMLNAVHDYRGSNPDFQFQEPFNSATAPFMLKLRLSFMIGLGLALPFIVLQIWGFVSPGLKPSEKKPVKALAPASVVLFAIGGAFCWIILPKTFQWFLSFMDEFPGSALFQEPGSMVFFSLKMIFAFGVGFQLPLVVYIAGRLGIIGPDTLIHYWRQAIVFVFVTSAILTPSGDVFSLLMMAVPLSLLLMLSIFMVKITARRGESIPELNELD